MELDRCSNCSTPLGNATWTVHGESAIYCSEQCFYRACPDVARKYGIVPSTVDELIDWLAEPTKNNVPPIVLYRCDKDKYDIYYSPSLEEATYVFDLSKEKLEVAGITGPQVVYLVQTGYWRELKKDD